MRSDWPRRQIQKTAPYRRLSYRRQASWANDARSSLSEARPGTRRRPPIRLWWWRGSTPNLGDELTWLLVERITGRRTVRRSLEECDVVGVGSHLEKVYAGMGSNRPVVLGSGFLHDGEPGDAVGLPVVALRGASTLGRVPDAAADTLLADPGLLAPQLLIDDAPPLRGGVVVVPHQMHAGTPFVAAARSAGGVEVVDVRDNPLDTIARIAASRFVYSSSLHGLVIADSLGIPNAWIEPGAELYGGDYKFADYYSSFGIDRSSVPMSEIGDDPVSFAKAHLDDPAFCAPESLVVPKQERLAELFADLASV